MSKQKQTVFYSWQSDIPSNLNKNFILDALERAVAEIVSSDLVAVEPVVDRDTLNVPGAPNITEKIFEKIEQASAFVADVTIIGNAKLTEKAIPNPNVMLELGYALKVVGDDRLILIANTEFGSIQDLPFDLKGRRTLPYSLKMGQESEAETQELKRKIKKDLQNDLVEALKSILSLPPKGSNRLPSSLIILKGAETLREKVATSIGPRGGRVSFLALGERRKTVTRDGLVIASQLTNPDYHSRLGIEQLSRVADETREQVGDGAKTSIILCYDMVKGGYEAVTGGALLSEVIKGMEVAVQSTINFIKGQTKPLATDDIYSIGFTAGGEIAAKLLTEAFNKANTDGVIRVEESSVPSKPNVEFQEGVVISQGYISDQFANDPETGNCLFDECFVLVYDGKISSHHQIYDLISKIVDTGKPVLVIAEDVEGEALNFLIQNNYHSKLQCVAVKAPGYRESKSEWLRDIAILTGASVFGGIYGTRIESAQLTNLGIAKRIIVERNQTQIIEGSGNQEKINIRLKQLRSQIPQTAGMYDQERLQERLANLSGNITKIKVGGKTSIELYDNQYKVTTAMHSIRGAIEKGFVIGGGVIFSNAQDWLRSEQEKGIFTEAENIGVEAIINTLKEPLRCLLKTVNGSEETFNELSKNDPNQGFNLMTKQFEDLRKARILDSALVIETCLEIAFSHAKMILETTSWETINPS